MADDNLSRLFPTWLDGRPWPLTYEDGNRTRIRREELRTYVPNSREQMVNAINDTFYDGGREGNRYAENVGTLLDFPLGLGHGIYDTTRAASEGRPREAAISLVMALPPPPVRKAAKEANQAIRTVIGKWTHSSPELKSGNHTIVPRTQTPATPPHVRLDDKSAAAEPRIIQPNSSLIIPRPHLIRPNSSLIVPGPNIIRPTNGPHDWIDDIRFGKPAIPGGRSTPWVVQPGPLRKPPRDSSLDYPNGALLDEYGNVRRDIDDRALIARIVAGRRRLGEKDVAVTPSGLRSVIEDGLGVPINRVPRDQIINRALGQVALRPDGFADRIDIWDRLPDDQAFAVLAHEFGHVSDWMAGSPPTTGLEDELLRLYSENLTGELHPERLIHPRDRGYPENMHRGELVAEAFRTQIVDPNTIKSIAPKTAAFVRKHLNEHPILSKFIQANSIPIGLLGGAMAMGTQDEAQAKQPGTTPNASLPDPKIGLRRIAAALPEPARRKPVPATLESISRTLRNQRTGPLHGGPH